MSTAIHADMWFRHIDNTPPTPQEVLRQCVWDVEKYNAPFLAGRAGQPSHDIVEYTAGQVFSNEPIAELPDAWSETDKLNVVGDISHELEAGSDFVIVRTTDFKQAGELLAKLGYRPAHAGEFLQLMWWVQNSGRKCCGWFLCYAGRQPGYAAMAEYNGHQKPPHLRVIFDTFIGNQIEEGYISANMDTYCLFVPKR